MSLFGNKGYFYTIDALFAITVVALGVIIVIFGFISEPITTPQFIVADDVLRILASTTVSQDSLAGISYFQQIGEYVTACTSASPSEASILHTRASSLGREIVHDRLIPEQFNLKLSIINAPCQAFDDPIVLVERGGIASFEAASTVISVRKIIFDTSLNIEFFDPYVLEVLVWR